MRKHKIKILIIMVMFLSNMIYGVETIDLETILDTFDEKSDYSDIENLEEEKITIKKKGNFKERWHTLNYSISPTYNYYENEENMPMNLKLIEDLNRYPGNLTLNFSYRELYLKLGYSDLKDNMDRNNYKVGLSKSLNDFIYSEEEYTKKSLNIEVKKNKNNMKSKRISKKEELINSYVEIMNLLAELKVKKESYRVDKKELVTLKEKKEIGEAVQLDINYLDVQLRETQNEIKYLNENIKNKKEALLEKTGFKNTKNIKLKELKKIEKVNVKGNRLSIYNKKLEMESQKEVNKYYSRLSQPEIKFDVNYDIEGEIWTAGFVIQGNAFEYGTDVKVGKKELKELKIEKELLEKEVNIQENELILNHKKLVDLSQTKKYKMINMKRRYEVDREIYEKGYLGLMELMESKERYEKAFLDFKKVKNNLYGFRYRMKQR